MRNPFRKRQIPVVQRDPTSLRARFPDVEPEILGISQRVQQYTMTSPERLIALCYAVQYVVRQRIPGDIVECGVWRGGSMMAAALMLKALNSIDRELWLYDTFQGMTAPTAVDVDHGGQAAAQLLANQRKQDAASIWCYSPLHDVKTNLAKTDYPFRNIHCVVGPVEQTIPATMPVQISMLRLDTDWYESTKHELVHLFPRLSAGGVVIIDDYGHWEGCRKAVDEYFAETGIPILLNRIDYTGRIGVKPSRSIGDAMQNSVKLAG